LADRHEHPRRGRQESMATASRAFWKAYNIYLDVLSPIACHCSSFLFTPPNLSPSLSISPHLSISLHLSIARRCHWNFPGACGAPMICEAGSSSSGAVRILLVVSGRATTLFQLICPSSRRSSCPLKWMHRLLVPSHFRASRFFVCPAPNRAMTADAP
jgi:hypothetical protein